MINIRLYRFDWYWFYNCFEVYVAYHLPPHFLLMQLLQQLKRLICDLCRLYNLPQHPDVEMLDQPLPAGPISNDKKVGQISTDIHILITLLPLRYARWCKRSVLVLPSMEQQTKWHQRKKRKRKWQRYSALPWVLLDSSYNEKTSWYLMLSFVCCCGSRILKI